MRIVLVGPKGVGKTTLGEKIAKELSVNFYDIDLLIEEIYFSKNNKQLSCREIFNKHGENFFRQLENLAVKKSSELNWCVIATGGGTMFNATARLQLRQNSIIVYVNAKDDFLWQRIVAIGVPSFFEGEDGFSKMVTKNKRLYEATSHLTDIYYEIEKKNSVNAHRKISTEIINLYEKQMKSPSSMGEMINITTFGESHGSAVGVVLDGVAPGILISNEDIQKELNRRRPGQSKVTTQRNESDKIEILSGIFEGKTTGTPICMLVYNKDQDPSKYENLKNLFRPGHADFTFAKKYGLRDYRGGGRTSGRETIGRVASGAVAKKLLLERGIKIFAYSEEIAGITAHKEDMDFIEKNSVRTADPDVAQKMEEAITSAKMQHNSIGGVVKLIVQGMPIGIGDPVFYKLQARLSMAIFSIGAIKGVEFGAGFQVAKMTGSQNNDEMKDGKFLSNNAGGLLGGISTGQNIIARIAVKPTPSIYKEQQTITFDGNNTKVAIEGRHDPCLLPRIIPVVESMVAIVIYDALNIQDAIDEAKVKIK